MDRVLQNFDAPGGLDDNVEAVWVIGLQLVVLSRGIRAGELDVFIAGTEVLRNVHFQTTGGSNDDPATTALAKHLSQHKASGASTEDEDGRAHLGGDLVQAMSGARSRLKESCVDIGQVLDLEDAAGRVGAVLGETAVHGNTVSLEVLAEQLVAAAAVEADAAQLGVVCDHALADLEVLDFGAHGGNDADCFVAGNQRELLSLVSLRRMFLMGFDLTLAMNSPSWMCRSVPQTPQALTLIRTSFSRTSGRGSSTRPYFNGSEYWRALMVLGSLVTVIVIDGILSAVLACHACCDHGQLSP